MSITQEIKSQLARLLATEDLIVEHRSVETASFNVHDRVLTLPLWDHASEDVYDMLVSHEVGHALFTPDDWSWQGTVPQSFVNIVEDARIEKLMKRKYAGLPKTFYKGYRELSDKDFFQVADIDIDEMNMADRTNLYFKIGHFVDITFNQEENDIIAMIDKCETWEEVIDASKVLHSYCKAELEREKEQQKIDSLQGEKGADYVESDEEGDNEEQYQTKTDASGGESNMGSAESSDIQESKVTTPEAGNIGADEPEVKTADALDESLKDLINTGGRSPIYIELPDVDIKEVVIENTLLHERITEEWSETPIENFKITDQSYNKFKKEAQKEVNYLVKEFERRKSASAYARAATSRTGVLDMSKLHTYKFNEDIFQKVTTLPDGKNHGLIFMLDWSGSMSNVMEDTIKQLYNLVWFCRKIQIPFDVYAFTNDYARGDRYDENKKAYVAKPNLFCVEDTFSLMNIFTSKTRARDLDDQMRNIFRICRKFNRNEWCYSYDDIISGVQRDNFDVPIGMRLSGTPLNEAMICLHKILPQFKKENNVEKVQCVVLTDGEAYSPRYHVEVERPWEDEPFLGINHISFDAFLRDRKTGNNYKIDNPYQQMTDVLIKNLRDNFTNTNFIGIRIMPNRDAGSFLRRYDHFDTEYDKMMKSWKKNKSYAIKNSGYHTYFGMSSAVMSNDTEFEVKEDAKKSDIKRAFTKSLKNKKMNKKVLSDFMELIA